VSEPFDPSPSTAARISASDWSLDCFFELFHIPPSLVDVLRKLLELTPARFFTSATQFPAFGISRVLKSY